GPGGGGGPPPPAGSGGRGGPGAAGPRRGGGGGPPPRPRPAQARPARGGSRAGSRASPELLAQVDALPPATDTPGIDPRQARAADPRFTLRRLLRPFAIAFGVGLLLDGLDALANLAMPALVRGGIDHGVEAQAI